MLRIRTLLASLIVLLAPQVALAASWTNVDSSFTLVSTPLDLTAGDPKTYTLQAQNTSANTYTNLHFILPFHWTSSNPSSTQFATAAGDITASIWNNGTSMWDQGTTTIEATPISFLTAMNDTDISPLTVAEPYFGINATIGATDSVPTYFVQASVAPGGIVTLPITFDFNPGFIKTEFGGYFIVPVPEPGTLGLVLVAGMGLLARRRRA